MEKTGFYAEIKVKPCYEDCKYLLEYFQTKCLWGLKKVSIVYPDNVGIKDETIDCSHGDSEVTDNQEQH